MHRTPCRPLLIALVVLLAGCAMQPSTDTTTSAPAPSTGNKLAEVQTKLGIGYMGEGQLELAFSRLSRALELDANYSTAHNAMGLLQERLKNDQQAEFHYKRAVALSPTDSAAQTNYGSFLCRSGRYHEGEQRFLQALKNSLYERPELAYSNAGICVKTAGELDKAETYFRAALERNPKIPAALISMSELNVAKRQYLPARAYLQRYLEVARHSAKTLWLGVQIERELGDRRTEREYAMRLKTQYPDSSETRLLLESES